MPCYRSCKKFLPHYSSRHDETLHQNSSLHLSIGAYAARYQPYSLSYRFEAEYTDVPVPQTPAIVPQTGQFIVPPYYDLDDYVKYDGEEAEEEDEGAWNSDEEEDQEGNHEEAAYAPLCLLVVIVWIFCFA